MLTAGRAPRAALAVIDFETTGMSPARGGRATEIAAVLVADGRIVERYQSLMNSGARVPPFIEKLTGISDRMLAAAPAAEQVMREAAAFVGGRLLVAHNAAFDRPFWQAEHRLAGGAAGHAGPQAARFICTLLLARRLYPEAPNHRLGTLVEFLDLPRTGRAHRALADAEATAHLLLRIVRDVEQRFAGPLAGRPVDAAALLALQHAPRARLASCLSDRCGGAACAP